jgi:hypothetical protein
VAKAVPFRLRHHDGSATLYFSDVAIAQKEVGLLAGKCDMAALLTETQMSPTLTTCRMLHNKSPIGLVDSEAFMMLSCGTFATVTIDPDTRFGNNFFRTLLGRMGIEVRTVPTDAHWASHAEKSVQLLCVAFTKIAAEHAKLSPEAAFALAVRSVN